MRADGFRVLLSGLGHELAGFQDGGVAQLVKRGMTSFAVYNLVRNNEFDSSKAVAEPGYKPRPMAPSIAMVIINLKLLGNAFCKTVS